MKITFDHFEKSSYWHASADVSKLAETLRAHFGITYFDYCRAFDDNTCIMFFSDRNYVNYFFKHSDYQPPTSYLIPGKYLWQNTIPEHFLAPKLVSGLVNSNHSDTLTLLIACGRIHFPNGS